MSWPERWPGRPASAGCPIGGRSGSLPAKAPGRSAPIAAPWSRRCGATKPRFALRAPVTGPPSPMTVQARGITPGALDRLPEQVLPCMPKAWLDAAQARKRSRARELATVGAVEQPIGVAPAPTRMATRPASRDRGPWRPRRRHRLPRHRHAAGRATTDRPLRLCVVPHPAPRAGRQASLRDGPRADASEASVTTRRRTAVSCRSPLPRWSRCRHQARGESPAPPAPKRPGRSLRSPASGRPCRARASENRASPARSAASGSPPQAPRGPCQPASHCTNAGKLRDRLRRPCRSLSPDSSSSPSTPRCGPDSPSASDEEDRCQGAGFLRSYGVRRATRDGAAYFPVTRDMKNG
jgi:hypothetical protein